MLELSMEKQIVVAVLVSALSFLSISCREKSISFEERENGELWVSAIGENPARALVTQDAVDQVIVGEEKKDAHVICEDGGVIYVKTGGKNFESLFISEKLSFNVERH